MADQWLHQACMWYPSVYLPKAREEAPPTWTHDELTTMTEKVLCGKGTPIRLSHEEQENVITFIINNSQCMAIFLDKFKVNFTGE